MKNERKTEIKVGITVTLSLLLFIWIFGWAKNISLSAERQFVTVEFTNVSGLEVGDQVTIVGVRKGFVDEMSITNDRVKTRLSLDADVKLRKDAVFSISMLDLMGGKRVEIKPGKSKEYLDFSILHKGNFNADIPEVMSMVGKIDDKLPKIMDELSITLSSLNSYLNDKKMNDEIKSTLTNLADISLQLRSVINENRSHMNSIIKNTNELTSETKELLSRNKESINESIDYMNSVLKRSDSLLVSLNNIIAETQNQKNNIGKLVYNEKLINDLNETLQSVKDLSRIVTEQLNSTGLKVDTKVKLF